VLQLRFSAVHCPEQFTLPPETVQVPEPDRSNKLPVTATRGEGVVLLEKAVGMHPA
jgi:hypothetical protein